MMRTLFLTCGALAASAGVAFAQTPPAPAAAAPAAAPPAAPILSPVVIYDANQLISQSAAGADMRAKLTAINEQIRRELEPDVRQLQSELAAIQGTSVADAQTQAAQQRQASFMRLREQFQQKQERLSAVMELTERNALASFSQALTPVLRATMAARGGLIAIQAGNVDAFVPGVDITADLVAKLNTATRTVTVTRATLPTQGAAAAPAAAGAPATPAPTGTLPRQPAPATPPRPVPPR